jgi:hypothetical protein
MTGAWVGLLDAHARKPKMPARVHGGANNDGIDSVSFNLFAQLVYGDFQSDPSVP